MAGAKAFGEQNPNQGEDAVSWQTFSDGEAGIPDVSGDAAWGKLHLDTSGEEARSAVYDLGSAVARIFTLTENRYGTGDGAATLQIRGSGATFDQDDEAPEWETYPDEAITRTWRYVQVRETTKTGFLAVSSNGRYLLDGSGDPWLLLSDSPQGMLVTRSTADFATYFAARAAQGFNCAQVHIVAGTTFGSPSSTTFETYDGIKPFSTNGDISTPNATYFARLDTLVQTAASYGITVILNATEHIDAGDLWETNGNTKCYNWGAYLGNRYKNFSNIIWMTGNDFQDWSTDAGKVAADINVINGIQSADSNHVIFTQWLEYYVSASRDSEDFDAECTLDAAYTYYVAYDKVGTEYALTPAKPVFLIETYYQDYSTLSLVGTPFIVRKQNYWSMLSGACGVTVMNVNWPLAAGWDTELTTKECFTEMIHLRNLFTAYDWWELVPDTTNTVLTAGYGTKRTGAVQPTTDDYANCAYIEGSLAIIYMPENLTMTVDMTHFSGSVTCRWYDPTDGSYTADAASPHANSGTHDFSRATTNSASATDWVLVLSV